MNAVLGLELFDARVTGPPFQIVQIQFGGDRKKPGLDEPGGTLVVRALGALKDFVDGFAMICLLYTSPSPRDGLLSRMPSSA